MRGKSLESTSHATYLRGEIAYSRIPQHIPQEKLVKQPEERNVLWQKTRSRNPVSLLRRPSALLRPPKLKLKRWVKPCPLRFAMRMVRSRLFAEWMVQRF